MDADALQREWEHYTRLISGAATSTTVSGLAVPFTLGVSSIGVGMAAPAIHNARKKREIIDRHLQRHGKTHLTRKRDVLSASAVSGTVGFLTLGVGSVGADAITNSAAEHGFSYIAENELGVKVVTHLGLDAAAVAAEEVHMQSKKEQEAWKAYSQAVKEGKNPPLPTSDLKIPAATVNQAAGFQPVHQDTFQQGAPFIQVVSPSDPSRVAEAALIYFAPPPGQVDTKANSPLDRRHSASTVSSNVHSFPGEPLPFQPDNSWMVGTTTAISAPMTAGQSYGIQLQRQPHLQSHSPGWSPSESGGGTRPMDPVGLPATTDDMPHQTLTHPLPSPPPPSPYSPQPRDMNGQQYQPQTQRLRAHSTASITTSSCDNISQPAQPRSDDSRLLSSLPPPPPSPLSAVSSSVSPIHTPATPVSGYSTAYASAGKPEVPPQPLHGQIANPDNAPIWSRNYDPNDYVDSQRPRQQSVHSSERLTYPPPPPRTDRRASDQMTLPIRPYQAQRSATAISPHRSSMLMSTGVAQCYAAPVPQPIYSPQPGGMAAQQMPYFPPPPSAPHHS